jgi:phosphoribosylformimino-5-aminoimidazole carboxamide ribotide isomerase
MKFRPCIDLHSGQVKQIVGSTLIDLKKDNNDKSSNDLATNFETDRPASSYAEMYKRDRLTGGHVIMLGPGNLDAAKSALAAYPQGLQVGGGINASNAQEWLDAGASHVIITSYVFHNGQIDFERLSNLVSSIGKDKLVLDLSCRRKPRQSDSTSNEDDDPYYVVTDRWQTYTDVAVNRETLELLSQYCDEFLVHGVENEGKRCGILEDLVILLGEHSPIPVTYAGGVKDLSDLERVNELGKGKVDLTIGSALDCFGGSISYDDVVKWSHDANK